MKKEDKRRKKKALRSSRRKQTNRQARAGDDIGTLGHIRQARKYQIEGCWVGEGWQEGGMAVVVVSRRQPNDNIVFGTFLVDCYCLGLKNTYCNADIPVGAFRRDYLPQIYTEMRPVEISPALAHELVYGGIEYAAQFGFRAHRDFKRSKLILDPPDVHPPTGTVEFGHNGKPLYVQGPHDNERAIIQQLERTVGAGNYGYVLQVGESSFEDWE